MKFQILFLFLFTTLNLNGQTIPTDTLTGKFKYEIVIQADTLEQGEIYDRAKNWIVRNLKSSDNVINLDDVGKNSIIATGNILLSDESSGLVKYRNVVLNFKFSVYCRERRYKVVVDNFILNYMVDKSGFERLPKVVTLEDGYQKEGVVKGTNAKERTYIETNQKIEKLITDLKTTVLSGTMPGDKSDW